MNQAKYTALQIAKYFISKSIKEEDRAKLTNLKLQKLLYVAQGWYLANYKKPLFKDPIEAWKYGPAVRNVYQEFKDIGNSIIQISVDNWEINDIDKNTQIFLNEVWNTYKDYSGIDLVSITHNDNPYKDARKFLKEGEKSDIEISILSMQDFFSKKLHGNK